MKNKKYFMKKSIKLQDVISNIMNAKNAGLKYTIVSSETRNYIKDLIKILYKEGFIQGYQTFYVDGKTYILIIFRYLKSEKNSLTSIILISKPGKQVATGIKSLWKIKTGLGSFILSTSKGLLIDQEARFHNVGGILLCSIV